MTNCLTAEIQESLVRYLSRTPGLIMTNTFVLGSRWESDVILVTNAFYWHEYEIKTSMADYRRDFQKCYSSYHSHVNKHASYQETEPTPKPRARDSGFLPRPKSFSFVAPLAVANEILPNLPQYCGLLSWDPDPAKAGWPIRSMRKAPTLPNPVGLSKKQLFNMAKKLSIRRP